MSMSKPSAPVEALKYTLTDEGGGKAKIQLAWADHIASVPVTLTITQWKFKPGR
jgi:hypothetical protein